MRTFDAATFLLAISLALCSSSDAFSSPPPACSKFDLTRVPFVSISRRAPLASSTDDDGGKISAEGDDALSDVSKATAEEAEVIGNLIADDEWMGLGMELSELVRVAVLEELKSSTADFIGKDEYKIGDISKELDSRVKNEVAKIRDKDEYELGDLSAALDKISKDLTCELTGKDDYEFGDLSSEIDTRVKSSIAEFCGKDTYEFGDLAKEMDRRVQAGVEEFTGKEGYEFGDISIEIENRRKKWIENFLGKEAADNYEFGDITKQALSNFTGKDEYQFGDVSKKIMGDLFGKRKRGGGDGGAN